MLACGTASVARCQLTKVTPLFNRVVDLIWFLITWTLLVAVGCGLLFGIYVYNRADEEIRAYVETKFAKHYAPLSVTLKSARILEREGFELRGLSIRDTNTSGDHTELVFIDRITIACKPTLEDLLRCQLRVRHITISHPTFRIGCDQQGQWNLGPLLVPPSFCGNSKPTLQVVNGTAEISDPREGRRYTLRDIELNAKQIAYEAPKAVSAASIDFDDTNVEPIRLNTASGPKIIQLAATFTGDYLQHTAVNGVIYPGQNMWRFRGNVPHVEMSPELRKALPLEATQYLDLLPTLRSGGSFQFDVSHDPRRSPALQYAVNGQLINGRMDDSRLTFPVTDLQATFHFDHLGLLVEPITGRYGEANLQLTCRRQGLSRRSPWELNGAVRHLRIDRNLISLLPSTVQDAWQRLQPQGLVDAKFQLRFDGQRWYPEDVQIACRDLAIVADIFPYPLTKTSGHVSWHNQHVEFDLHAMAATQPVTLAGEFDSPGPNWSGWFTARTDDRIPLDENFIGAMKPKLQDVIRDFSPRGWLSAQCEFRRDSPNAILQKNITVDLFDTSVQHKKLPYPLHRVQGHLQMINDAWEFRELRGHNDSAKVTCEGRWTPGQTGGTLRLNFDVTDLPLEEEVRLALPAKPRTLWKQLSPRGRLDHLSATFQYSSQTRESDVSVNIEQAPSPEGVATQGVSIHPLAFPYRIDDVTGLAQFVKGQVQFQRLRGKHGPTHVVIGKGNATTQANGDWQLRLEKFSADHVNIDHDILAAVPSRLNKQLIEMRVKGPLNLQGALAFYGNESKPREVRSAWNLAVDADNASLFFGVGLDNLTGTVRLKGSCDPNHFYSQGFLEIDSLVVQDVHITQIRGPLWFDDERALIGSWAQPDDAKDLGQRLSAQVFGGEILCDGQASFDEQRQFQLRLDLKNGKTPDLLDRISPRSPPIRGRTSASLDLSGNPHGRHTFRGGGTIQLRDANLYELPFILTLLRTLRSGSVDRTAFDQSDIKFRIHGEHTYFDQLDLIGDGITLKGVGEMTGRQELNLDFYTILGQQKSYLGAILPALGLASSQFLQIHVTGFIYNPVMTREVLPGLNDTLENLFPEFAETIVDSGERSAHRQQTGGSNRGWRR